MSINPSDDDYSSDDNYSSNQSNVAGETSKDAELPKETVCARTTEECSASSSCSHLKSYFEGMGFSPMLVEKVINENGEADADSLLETLFTYSALQASSSEHLNFTDGQDCSKLETGGPSGDFPVSSCQEIDNIDESSSMDFSLGSSQEIEEDFNECEEVSSDKRNSLRLMKFSEEEVACAISRLGEDASLTDMVEFILAAQTAGSFEDVESLNHCDDINNEMTSNATLFGTMEKTLQLLEMGFSENEVSEAISNFGAKVPLLELADSIFAQQLANMPDSSKPSCSSSQTDLRQLKRAKASSSRDCSDLEYWKVTSMREVKLEKSTDLEDGYGETRVKHESPIGISPSLKTPKVEASEEKPERSSCMVGRNSHTFVSEPPYFLYGAVVNISSATWANISQFLYKIDPEQTDASFFSALTRKEGYIHNLPTTNRTCVLPQPPLTITDVFPHMKKWWPSWDTREQLSCTWHETLDINQSCRRLEKILLESQGMISKEQQQEIVNTCRMMNLTWLGQYKLGPFEPGQVEQILGYPLGHTQIGDLQTSHRFRLLKGSFQTDTLGYHLSPLKRIFSDGLTLLSIFSGIGGAEVSLHRLGIRLRAVVCVESSMQNQDIIRRWWTRTGQKGELVMLENITMLRVKRLLSFIEKFGGFDLVVAGNPSSHVDGQKSGEVDYPSFYEFTRVLSRLRQLMKRYR